MVLAALILVVQGTPQARVHGEVREAETGRPLTNVIVHLTNGNVSVLTGDSGRYVLLKVPAGPQHITYRLIGYAPQTLDALVPREGQLEIHVALRPYPVQLPPLEVSTQLFLFPVERGDRAAFDHSVSLVDMKNHPLLAEPDALQSIAGGDVAMDPESPNGVHIRGGGTEQTAYLLDGIPVLSPYHVAGTFTAWNPDAIADLDLSVSSPSPGMTEAIAGVIAVRTRPPGARHSFQGSVSTSQVRGTLDGPIGGGVRYLLSGRTGFIPGFSSSNDASQVGSEAGDWLGKIEAPVLGGVIRLLGYYAGNEISADAAGAGQPINPEILRNDFSWHSFSAGATFNRTVSGALLQIVGWGAGSNASARWSGAAGVLDLDASRHDLGILLSAARSGEHSTTLAGIRLERSSTSYLVRSDSAGPVFPGLEAVTVVPAFFGQHSRTPVDRVTTVLGFSLSRADRRWFLSPRAQLRVLAGSGLTIKGSVSRLHQFGQSLRNPESVVGLVFPPDLYLGVDAPGIPVPRSDQATLGLELVPAAGMRVTLLGYVRALRDILLVAPGEAEPFATGAPASGNGRSRGIALRVMLASRRFSVVANYGIQRTRIGEGDSSYVPHFAPTHLFEGGVTVFPSATLSIRVGASGAAGRRTTIFTGALEWEACNLLDQGCEFGGSPHYGQDPLGGAALPTYFRVDASLRKHWHIRLAGRETMIALFGTVTNVFAGHNLLTYARTPGSGVLQAIEMRPLSPLVVGVDWRF
jgi:hypothetical protein